MRLDVPFLPAPGYAAFLSSLAGHLHSVYFGLPSGPVLDSRYRFLRYSDEELIATLQGLEGVRKYVLLNSRFYRPDRYTCPDTLGTLCRRLRRLRDGAGLDGLVFTDTYFLQALVDADRPLMETIEAVPGLNCHLDRFGKVASLLTAIGRMGARPPGKLLLDRRLNRRPGRLASIVGRIREAYPAVAVGLIANEGCLADCPFKPAHDAHIALGNMELAAECTHALNRDLGCIRMLWAHPEEIFRSPLIRPEDVDRYGGLMDFVKLSGRTLGAAFLERTVEAYVRRRFSGNLLALSDTLSALADRIRVDNGRLPADFWERACRCRLDCDGCGFCRRMCRDHLEVLPVAIRPAAGPEGAVGGHGPRGGARTD